MELSYESTERAPGVLLENVEEVKMRRGSFLLLYLVHRRRGGWVGGKNILGGAAGSDGKWLLPCGVAGAQGWMGREGVEKGKEEECVQSPK